MAKKISLELMDELTVIRRELNQSIEKVAGGNFLRIMLWDLGDTYAGYEMWNFGEDGGEVSYVVREG